MNHSLEQFLQMFTSHRQDNWVDFLSIAKFAYNDTIHTTTGLSPFYATYGYHPPLSFRLSSISTVPAAKQCICKLKKIHENLKVMIQLRANEAKRFYDRHSQQHSNIQVGDQVLLRHDYITTTTPSKKLSPKFLGPFQVTAKISDLVYELRFPKNLRIHNKFHVLSLEKYNIDTIPSRKQQPPPPIMTSREEPKWKVQTILNSRLTGRARRLHYLVAWQGYGPGHNSWEPASHLKNAPDIVKWFHSCNPSAPGPTST